MIFDRLDHAARYAPLHPRLAAAFDYLRSFAPATPEGRYPIEGDAVFALVQHYETEPEERRRWESHRRYVDVQYVAAGEEQMLYVPVSALREPTEYDTGKEVIFYGGVEGPFNRLHVPAGSFAVFFQEDGHMPSLTWKTPSQVRKVVVKVELPCL